MIEIAKKFYRVLDKNERMSSLYVLLLLIIVALFEAIGVASVLPFMSVLSNTKIINTNQYLSQLYECVGFDSEKSFLIFLGFVFLVLIICSLTLRAVAFWAQIRFSHKRVHAWSCRLLSAYLYQPYSWFLSQHSGKLGSSVLTEIGRIVHGVFFPFLQICSNGLVVIFLIFLMVIVDPLLALIIMVVLASIYTSLFWFSRCYLSRIGEESIVANRQRYKMAQEAFSGIKEVKISGLEEIFIERYRIPSLKLVQREVVAKVLSEMPSYVLQCVVFGGIISVLIYFIFTRDGIENSIPIFSIYAFAGYRLMPAMQSIYKSFTEMRYNEVVLNSLFASLCNLKNISIINSIERQPLIMENSLDLKNVSFQYPESESKALDDISLTISSGATLGIIGSTGSGKTTLVDVILGLLEPSSGSILIDNKVLNCESIRSWQLNIGYVPQHIYLSDDTISSNIAFGVPYNLINKELVEQAAKMASLHDFISKDLPLGYNTIVGERGVRLSGGQRQRIGIARALYRNPAILIFDEATSALDNLTERAVMESIHNLKSKKTIIIIAHRLSTVLQCDSIVYIEKGKIVSIGNYDDLVLNDNNFKNFVRPSI